MGDSPWACCNPPGAGEAPPHAPSFLPGGRPLRPSHKSAAHSAWSAWRAPSMPSAALPHWRLSPGSWFPQSSTTSGGEPGPREVRGIVSKASWAPRQRPGGSSVGRADPSSRESCGDRAADKPCSAQGLSSLLGKSGFAHKAPRPPVEHRQCQSGAGAKVRAQTPRTGPQGAEQALRGSRVFPLPSLLRG